MSQIEVEKIIEPVKASDGAGVKLKRSIGTHLIDYLDPFLMFDEFLIEDSPQGDPTSDLTVDDTKTAVSYLVCEDSAIFCGKPIIKALNHFETTMLCEDGDELTQGQKIAIIKGNAKSLLRYERILLNLLQRLIGISTLTRKYADITKDSGIKILDTRKTTPGLRLFEKYAVTVGGGYNHRLNLS